MYLLIASNIMIVIIFFFFIVMPDEMYLQTFNYVLKYYYLKKLLT